MNNRSPFLGVLSILCLGAPGVFAQGVKESDMMEARSIKLTSETMVYRLFKPKKYDATRKYPLVVCLHGVGERGSDNRVQVDREDLAHPWIEDSVQARVPHFIMVPQCPSSLTWGGMSGSGNTLAEAAKGILDAIDSLKTEFSLDTNRFYITGLSLGGAGTYHLLQMKPGYWAAAVPCSAGGDSTAITTIARTPIWDHQGSLDGGGAAGRRMALALENHRYPLVRFVPTAVITSPTLTSYSAAIKNGTKPEDLVFHDPAPPVTADSLRKAVLGGANYLYSELTGGDHRSGWMIAWHNPLLATWLFSKVKGGSSVSLAPRALIAGKNGSKLTLVFGNLSENPGACIFSVQGRSLAARPGMGIRRADEPLLVRMAEPVR